MHLELSFWMLRWRHETTADMVTDRLQLTASNCGRSPRSPQHRNMHLLHLLQTSLDVPAIAMGGYPHVVHTGIL